MNKAVGGEEQVLTTKEMIFQSLLWGLFGLMFVVDVLAPRFWGVGPAVFGLVLFLLYRFIYGSWARIPALYLCVAGGFFLVMALSYFWASYPDSVLDRVKSLFPILLGGGLLIASAKKAVFCERAGKVLIFVYAFAVILIGVNIFGRMPIHNFLHGKEFFAYALLSEMNRPLCALAVMIWPLSLVIVRSGERVKLLMMAVWGALIFCALGSFSQSTQLALLLGGIAFYLSLWRGNVMVYLFLGSVVIYCLVLPWFVPGLFEYLKSLGLGIGLPGYPMERLEMWNGLSMLIHDNLLLGYGLEATKNLHFDTSYKFMRTDNVLHPHNMALQFWLEAGLLGIVAFLICFTILLKHIAWLDRLERAVIVGCVVTVFVVANVGYGFWQSWWIGLLVSTAALFTLVLSRPVK